MNENWVNDWYLLGVAAEITPGTVAQRTIGSTLLAVFNLDGSVFAVPDRCGHCGAALSEGVLREGCLECGSCRRRFFVDDPARAGIGGSDMLNTFPLMVVDGEVFAWIEDGA